MSAVFMLAMSACDKAPDAKNGAPAAGKAADKAPAPIEMRACSFNLRGTMKKDTGERSWEHRKKIVANFFKKYDIDICGAQESNTKQFDAFNALMPEYGYFGESSMGDWRVINLILYKKSKYELLEHKTLWLAETPEVKTKILDSAEPRTVNYGKFLDKKTNRVFYVFSTHLDHRGRMAKPAQAKFLMKFVSEISNGAPFFLVGDFNSGDGSRVIRFIKGLEGIIDARDVSKAEPINMPHTHHGFKGHSEKGGKDAKRIDFMFLPKGTVVKNYEVSDYKEDGAYPSDHYPIFCDIVLK